ncbi:MAG: imidazoleglycerol-phosphate dehydratase [Candidatus Asgardarchaeia archaeon]
MNRFSKIERKTKETSVYVEVNLDDPSIKEIDVPIVFFKHLLDTFSKYGKIGLKIKLRGDMLHHMIEDSAIVLGRAIDNALGDKTGIRRYGHEIIPMDDALVLVAIDLSGRPYYILKGDISKEVIEDTLTCDLEHFLETFAFNLRANIHINVFYGKNMHHVFEAIFKALGLSLRKAISITESDTLSTKGMIE